MKYEVIGYQRYTSCDKVYFSVEADSPEEALKLAKENPEDLGIDDCKSDFEFIDLNDWKVL